MKWTTQDVDRELSGKHGAERDAAALVVVASALAGGGPPPLDVERWAREAAEREGVDLRVMAGHRGFGVSLVLVVDRGRAYQVAVSDYELHGSPTAAVAVLEEALRLLLKRGQ